VRRFLHAWLGPYTPRVVDTVENVVERPEVSLTPALVAIIFLLTQHLVDQRDPKLAVAARTRRDLTLSFPRTYRRTADDVLLPSSVRPPLRGDRQ